MEFLEIGEKIKKVRKELNMKQLDLQDTNTTRALISMIEIGKRVPNKITIDNIINKFKNRADELGVKFNLEPAYFLNSAKDDAKAYCRERSLNNADINDLLEVLKIADKYNIVDVAADTFLKLAEIRFENLDYVNSHTDYLNALECYKNLNILDKVPYIYNMLGRCCINQTQNIQALSYFNFAYHYSILYKDEDIKKKSIYNIALCNKKLGRIDDVLKYIDIYMSVCNKEDDFLIYAYAIILQSNCYYLQENIEDSIKVLNNLLSEFTDKSHPLLANIYNNLGVMYCNQKSYEESLKCFNVSEKIRLEKDIKSLSHTLIGKSQLFNEQGLYTDSIATIKSAIKNASAYNDIEYILKGYYELINLYKILSLDNEIEANYRNILKVLMETDSQKYKDDIVKVCIELLDICLAKNDMQQSINILAILKNIALN